MSSIKSSIQRIGEVLVRTIVLLLGLVLLAASLFLFLVAGVAAVSGIFEPKEREMLWWSLPCIVITAFCVIWSMRLVLGKQRRGGGLLPPRLLVGVAMLFVAMPMLALLSGSYRSMGIPTWVIVVLLVMSLPTLDWYLTMARTRRNRGRNTENSREE